MVSKKSRQEVRVKKHMKIRNRFSGTAECPRLAVYRSNNHMSAQIIDDTVGNTLVSASTTEKERYPITQRVKVFGCSCCPPNILRFVNSVADFLYTDDGQIAFSLQSVSQVSNSGICTLVSSSNGNSENQVRQNNWTLVSIDLSQAQQLVGVKRINLEISVNTDVYIRNARVSAEDISTFKYYTVEHYYGDTLLGSETLYAASGSAPAVYYGAYNGYMPLPASNNTIPATVADDNSTVVTLYYTVAAPIANTDGNGYLYPYAHGTTTYGDVNYNATYHDESGTYNDSYEIKGTSTGYPVLRIMGVDKLYVVDRGYKKLTFKIYAPNENVADNFYVKLYTDSGSSYDIRLCDQNVLNNSNVVSLYDSNGVRIYSLGNGTWTTVEVNLDEAALNFGTPRINVEISGRYRSDTDSFYIKDIKFSIGEYGSYGNAFFKEGEWILEDLDW